MAFHIISSPYTHNHQATNLIMLRVALATFPGMAVQCYFFGWGNLIQVALAIFTAWSAEAVILYLRRQPILTNLGDNSALLTAILLGNSLPPLAPWWLIVIGTAFAIVIAKQLYGGLGKNPFNPAMIGYVVLLISFPVQMTSWLPPKTLQVMPLGFFDIINIIFSYHTSIDDVLKQLQIGIDGISQATPLDTFKTGLHAGYNMEQLLAQPIFRGMTVGIGWQWVNIGYLLGGLFLVFTNTIRWYIPISFLVSLTVCATFGWLFFPDTLASPLMHLFSGATMLCAFFIATDPITASTTHRGSLIFGMLIGFLVWLIRSFGSFPDGVAFAVLLANICVPLIDYYTQPRVYGHRKE